MVVSISAPYGVQALSDCCVDISRDAYCGGTSLGGGFCNAGGYGVAGTIVLYPISPLVECALDDLIPTSQADCTNINGNPGLTATFVPARTGYTSSGNCVLQVTSDEDCGCPNSIPITKSVDLCDLAGAAYNQLNPDSLNLFGAPCI